jgi:hypothetical protein
MWPFRKKRLPEFDYQKELAFINDNLRDSFSKIKQDMKIMKDWISHLNDRDNLRKKDLEAVNSKISGMDETIGYITLALKQRDEGSSEQQIEAIPTGTIAALPSKSTTPLNNLTDTQLAMFHRAGLLLDESGQEWIAIKALAIDLYPDKEYDQVRSTTSEYVGILVDNSLLEKRRRGKQTYIGLTKKGAQIFDQVKGKVLKKEATKKTRNN